jgi:predicted RNA-binding Zn-ribbon protein involved in translation (DUF1610 family)
MGCCDGWELKPESGDVVTECPDCGTTLINGEPDNGCNYSPEECKTCGWSPCDQSC